MAEKTPQTGGSSPGTEIVVHGSEGSGPGVPGGLLLGADVAVGGATQVTRLALRIGQTGWRAGVVIARHLAALPGADRAGRVLETVAHPLADDGREVRARAGSALQRATERLLERFLPDVVDALDVDGLVQRIDIDGLVRRIEIDELVQRIEIDQLVQRIDIDELVQRIDIDALVQRIAIDQLVGRIEIDELVRRIGIDELVQRIEIDQLVQRIEIDELVQRIDIDALVQRIAIDQLVGRIEIDQLVQRIDIDELVQRIDIDALVQRIAIDRLVGRIEIDELVRRIDIDRLVARLDVDAIVERIDVNEVVQRMDIDKVVEETELGTIVSRSTSGFASGALDAARNQTAGVDTLVGRAVNRMLRRSERDLPVGPPLLAGESDAETAESGPSSDAAAGRPDDELTGLDSSGKRRDR